MCGQESLSQHIINPGTLETVVDAPIRHLPDHLRINSVLLNTAHCIKLTNDKVYSQKRKMKSLIYILLQKE